MAECTKNGARVEEREGNEELPDIQDILINALNYNEEMQEESEKELKRPHVHEKEIEVWTLTEEKPTEATSNSNETSEDENVTDRISSEKENKDFTKDEPNSSELDGKLLEQLPVCEPAADEKKDTKITQESQEREIPPEKLLVSEVVSIEESQDASISAISLENPSNLDQTSLDDNIDYKVL
ncbi:unnamed protein product [Hymenolepis diminuta]|uniref:Fibrous sheath-interacting protein 1 n=1 Tax=Hymenolepis diminuta TaxID=6216 RepID=A0A0R3SV90_HYMDI|nr:unnamed protein product [Hymenolepis diminuta]